jgi:ABC-type glutathione transport system ATPase component
VEDITLGTDTRALVAGVSFALGPGETVALVGPSGSGKTLVTRAIVGVLPPGVRRRGGRIALDGVALPPAPDGPAWRPVRGRRLAWLPQEPHAALDPLWRVGAQVAEVRRVVAGDPPAAARDAALALLAECGVDEPSRRAMQWPHELSGGLAQRAALALALAADPAILLADEPTTALDAIRRLELLDTLRARRTARGLALLFTTHDAGVAAYLGGVRVAVTPA